MKKFLHRMAVFGALLLALLCLSYVGNRCLLRGSVFRLAPSQDLLILGDSHAMTALDPERIPGAVNVAQDAEPLVATYFKCRFILDRNPGVRGVILGISYNSLAAYNDRKFAEEPWATAMFERYYPVLDFRGLDDVAVARDVYNNSWLRHSVLVNPEAWKSWVRQRTGSRKVRHPYIGRFQTFTRSRLETGALEDAIRRHYGAAAGNAEVSAVAGAYLRRIAALTGNRGVRLYLVILPVHPDYAARVPEAVRHGLRTLTADLAGGQDVTLIDFRSEVFPDTYFADHDHLNRKGADAVSSRVAAAVRARPVMEFAAPASEFGRTGQ